MIKRQYNKIKSYLKKVNHRTYIVLGLFLLLLLLSVIVFRESYGRTWASVKNLGHSFVYIFSRPQQVDGEFVLPPLPNDLTVHNFYVALNLKELTYTFKAWAMILFNKDFFVFESFAILEFLLNALRFMIYIPYIILFWMLIKMNVLNKDETKEYRESKALTRYKVFERKYIVPVGRYLESWRIYLKREMAAVYKVLYIGLFLFSYRILAMAIDFFSFYFVFTKTFSFQQLPNLLSSYIIDAITVLLTYSKIAIIIPAVVVAVLLRHHFAKKKLVKMVGHNKKEQGGHGVSTVFYGPPGTGKTEMMTAMTFLANQKLIEDLFMKLAKFSKMFPDFPYQKIEEYIRTGIKENLFVNRAQVHENIKDLYRNNIDGFVDAFDYDPRIKKCSHFDGVKFIGLDAALATYAEVFFLYDSRKPLNFANYSINFDFKVEGHFPVYDFDTIKHDKEIKEMNTANIINFDSRRIYNRVADSLLDSDDEVYIMDGHVESITEIDKERGNKFSNSGLSRSDLDANKVNDGFNDSVKTTRHEYTIDSTPFVFIYSDTQRANSLNADLRETNEGRIEINKRSEEKVTIPLFELDYLIFGYLSKAIDDYLYEFRKLRNDGTLYNYLLGKLASRAGNRIQRLYNLYSYSVISYTYRQNVSSDSTGDVSHRKFYMINQVTRANNYATDAYSEYFKSERLKATKGFYDAKRYNTHRASVQEIDAQRSYWGEKLKSMTKTVVEKEDDDM